MAAPVQLFEVVIIDGRGTNYGWRYRNSWDGDVIATTKCVSRSYRVGRRERFNRNFVTVYMGKEDLLLSLCEGAVVFVDRW